MRRVVGEVDVYVRALQSAKSLADPTPSWRRGRSLPRPRAVVGYIFAARLRRRTGSPHSRPTRCSGLAVFDESPSGPGLDFTDKAEGYDFYPQQTINLFRSSTRSSASVSRNRAASHDHLLSSPRINQHLDAARGRARRAGPCWSCLRDLICWLRSRDANVSEKFRRRPAGRPRRRRRVRFAPSRASSIVLGIVPRIRLIVLQRRERLADDERFDLVVATNIFAYYDAFEQSTALSNAAATPARWDTARTMRSRNCRPSP